MKRAQKRFGSSRNAPPGAVSSGSSGVLVAVAGAWAILETRPESAESSFHRYWLEGAFGRLASEGVRTGAAYASEASRLVLEAERIAAAAAGVAVGVDVASTKLNSLSAGSPLELSPGFTMLSTTTAYSNWADPSQRFEQGYAPVVSALSSTGGAVKTAATQSQREASGVKAGGATGERWESELLETGQDKSEAKSAESSDWASDFLLQEGDLVAYEVVSSQYQIAAFDPKDDPDFDEGSIPFVPLVGGGGGGGGALSIAGGGGGFSFSGSVIDGYVEGATVFLDLNGNLIHDADEPVSVTDSTGAYSFSANVSGAGLQVVSLGGVDTSTLAAIDYLVAPAEIPYVTPLSTVYAYAETAGAGSGTSVLGALNIDVTDLSYDPIAKLNGSLTDGDTAAADEAIGVLAAGASLLTVVSNAASLVSELAEVDMKSAASKVFGQIATIATSDAGDFSKLLGANSVDSKGVLTAVIEGGLSRAGVDNATITSYQANIASVSDAVVAVTNAMAGITRDAFDDLAALSSTGQDSLASDIKSFASLVKSGDAGASAKLASITTAFTGGAIDAAKAAAKAKLAFNKADPNNPVKTVADSFVVDAPMQAGVSVTQSFDVLKNDSLAGGGDLVLVSAGVVDPNSLSGVGTFSGGNQVVLGGAASAVDDRYNGLILSVVEGDTLKTAQVTDYDGTTKTVTLNKSISITGDAQFLIAKGLPNGYSINIVDSKIAITVDPTKLDSDPALRFDLVYVAQKSGDATVAKAGLATFNLAPPAPVINFSGQRVVASEASGPDDVSVSSAAYTAVDIPLTITGGLGVNGSVQITGLPQGSLLRIGASDASPLAGQSGVWTYSGNSALTANFSILQALVPADFSGAFELSAKATARFGGVYSTASTDKALPVQISPVTDGLELGLGAESAVQAALVDAISEDVPTALFDGAASQIRAVIQAATLADDDGSEGIGIRLKVTGQGSDPVSTLALPEIVNPYINVRYVDAAKKDAVEVFGVGYTLTGVSDTDNDNDRTDFQATGKTYDITLVQAAAVLKGLHASNSIGSATDTNGKHAVYNLAEGSVTGIPGGAYFLQAKDVSEGLATVIAGITLSPPENLSGANKVGVSAEFGTFEASLLVDGFPATADFKAATPITDSINLTPVSDTPVTNSIALSLAGDATTWAQADYLPEQSPVYLVPVAYQVSSPDAGETLYVQVSKADLTAAKATLVVTNKVVNDTGDGWLSFLADAGGAGSFVIEVPTTISRPFNIRVRPGAEDAPDTIQSGEAFALEFPFVETPKEATITFKSLTGYAEDAGIPLSDLLIITPGAGREIGNLAVHLGFPSGSGLTLQKSGVTVASGVADLSSGSLSDYVIKTPANFRGDITGLTVFARDSVGAATQDSKTITGTVNISAVADGLNAATFATTATELTVNLFANNTLYDPANKTAGIFGKISSSLLDPTHEKYVVKLKFVGVTDSNAAVLKVGETFVLGEVSGGSLNYSLTSKQLSGTEAITLYPRAALGSATKLTLAVSTSDGSAIQATPNTHDIALNLNASALTPDAAIGDASGAEDSEIEVPVNVTINSDRVAFEKIGFEVTSANTKLQGGVFKASDTGSPSQVHTFSFDSAIGQWNVYDGTSQLDFSTLKFVPPSNFSGIAQFNFLSYAKTSSATTKAAASDSVSINVTPASEAFTFNSGLVVDKVLIEDTATLIDLKSLVTFSPASLLDSDEQMLVTISLPANVSLQRNGEALAPSTGSVGSGATFSFSVALTAIESGGLDGYQLVPTANYASSSSGGTATLTMKAIEPSNGNSGASSVGTKTFNLSVKPIADTPPAIVKVATTATLTESGDGSNTWVALNKLVKLSSDVSVDPSEDVFVLIKKNDNLQFATKAGSNYTNLTATHTKDAVDYWKVSAAEFKTVEVRGIDFYSGSLAQGIKVLPMTVEQATSPAWAEAAVAYGSVVSADLQITAVASGVDAAAWGNVALNPKSTSETLPNSGASAGVTLDKFLPNAFDNSSLLKDSTEAVFYKITFPTDKLSLVPTTGAPALSGLAAGTGSLSYVVAASEMSKYALVAKPYFSGAITSGLTIEALSKDGSALSDSVGGNVRTLSLTIDPVANTPTLIAPAQVNKLLTDANSRIDLPIFAKSIDTDGSEALSVSLKFSGVDAASKFSLYLGADIISSAGVSVVAGSPPSVTYTFAADTTYGVGSSSILGKNLIARLSELKFYSTEDFRGTSGRIELTTTATVTDGSAIPLSLPKTTILEVYQPIDAPTVTVSPSVVAGNVADLGLSVTLPGSVPSGVDYSNVSLLVTGVPSDAVFFIKKTASGQLWRSIELDGPPIQEFVGASLGKGGVWLLSMGDVYPGGIGTPLYLLSEGGVNDGNLTFQAFISDPTGGSSASSASASSAVDFNLGSQDADPLIFSIDGSALESQATAASFQFDIDDTLTGDEHPLYWVTSETDGNFAYLVKPGYVEGTQITIANLYKDFDALGAGDGVISDQELSGVKFWFDSSTSGTIGVVDVNELKTFTDLGISDFEIILPAVVSRPSESGEVQSLYEAQASWNGGANTGSIIAAAIPFQAIPTVGTSSGDFSSLPVATLNWLGEAGSGVTAPITVPEDVSGGPGFTVSFSKAKHSTIADEEVTHLFAVYGLDSSTLPTGLTLSAGAEATADGQTFWVLTEEQVASPIYIQGLPENFVGSIGLSVQAVASVIQGGIPDTEEGPTSSTKNLSIEGFADVPTIDFSASSLSSDEGATIYLTADGTSTGGSLMTVAVNGGSDETGYVRFKVDGLSGYTVQDLSGSVPAVLTSRPDGFYEVLASNLSSVVLDPGTGVRINGDFSIELVGVAKQAGTEALSEEVMSLQGYVRPVADGVSASALTIDGVAASLTEGGNVFLSGSVTLIDSQEIPLAYVLAGGNSEAIAAIQGVDGGVELTITADIQSAAGITDDDLGNWRLYELSSLSSTAVFNSVEVLIDPFFDGGIDFYVVGQTREPSTGELSAYTASTKASATLNPVVSPDSYQLLFEDASDNEVTALNITEGVSNSSASLYINASTFDPDETITVELSSVSGALFSFTDEGSGQWTVTYLGGTPSAASDLQIQAAITQADSGVTEEYTALFPGSILLEKAASQPAFADTTAIANVSMNDGEALIGAALPAVVDDPSSDDVLTYRLSGLPNWLSITDADGVPVGELLSTTGSESTYLIKPSELSGLRFTCALDGISADETVTLEWIAVSTEPTNFSSKETTPKTFDVTRSPVAVEPEILFPSSFDFVEATSATRSGQSEWYVDLSAIEVVAGTFSPAVIATSVTLDLAYGSENSVLKFVNSDFTDYSGGLTGLTLAQVQALKIVSENPDFNGSDGFSVSAKQVFGSQASSVTVKQVAVTVTNTPENVTFEKDSASITTLTIADISEEDGVQLSGISVGNFDVNGSDELSLALSISTELQLYDISLPVYEVLAQTVSTLVDIDTNGLEDDFLPAGSYAFDTYASVAHLLVDTDGKLTQEGTSYALTSAGKELFGTAAISDRFVTTEGLSRAGIDETSTLLEPASIDGSTATYLIDSDSLAGNSYAVLAPSGSGGVDYSLSLSARAIDGNTGVSGEPATLTASFGVIPKLDAPNLAVSVEDLRFSEDRTELFDVVAFSPDASERAEITFAVSDPSLSLANDATNGDRLFGQVVGTASSFAYDIPVGFSGDLTVLVGDATFSKSIASHDGSVVQIGLADRKTGTFDPFSQTPTDASPLTVKAVLDYATGRDVTLNVEVGSSFKIRDTGLESTEPFVSSVYTLVPASDNSPSPLSVTVVPSENYANIYSFQELDDVTLPEIDIFSRSYFTDPSWETEFGGTSDLSVIKTLRVAIDEANDAPEITSVDTQAMVTEAAYFNEQWAVSASTSTSISDATASAGPPDAGGEASSSLYWKPDTQDNTSEVLAVAFSKAIYANSLSVLGVQGAPNVSGIKLFSDAGRTNLIYELKSGDSGFSFQSDGIATVLNFSATSDLVSGAEISFDNSTTANQWDGIDAVKISGLYDDIGDGGSFTFTDADTTDVHKVEIVPLGVNYIGQVVATVSESAGSGTVNWDWSAAGASIDYLADGEVLQQEYRLVLRDYLGSDLTAAKGGQDFELISLEVTGSNDAPIVSLSSDYQANLENGGLHALTQLLDFIDVDLSQDSTDYAFAVSDLFEIAANGALASRVVSHSAVDIVSSVALSLSEAENLGELAISYHSANQYVSYLMAGESIDLHLTVAGLETAFSNEFSHVVNLGISDWVIPDVALLSSTSVEGANYREKLFGIEESQYAASVTAGDVAASTALGASNAFTLPSGNAWTPSSGGSAEQLTVGFDNPLYARGAVIRGFGDFSKLTSIEFLSGTNVISYDVGLAVPEELEGLNGVKEYRLKLNEPLDAEINGIRLTIDAQTPSALQIDSIKMDGVSAAGSQTFYSANLGVTASVSGADYHVYEFVSQGVEQDINGNGLSDDSVTGFFAVDTTTSTIYEVSLNNGVFETVVGVSPLQMTALSKPTAVAGNDFSRFNGSINDNYVNVISPDSISVSSVNASIDGAYIAPPHIQANIMGTKGNDAIVASSSSNGGLYYGGDGADLIVGSGGRDMVILSSGIDVAAGGLGADAFVVDGVENYDFWDDQVIEQLIGYHINEKYSDAISSTEEFITSNGLEVYFAGVVEDFTNGAQIDHDTLIFSNFDADEVLFETVDDTAGIVLAYIGNNDGLTYTGMLLDLTNPLEESIDCVIFG